MLFYIQNYHRLLSAIRNGDRLLTKQIFCFLQMPGWLGHLKLPNAQPPGLIIYQIPGEMLTVRIDSHISSH